MVKSVKILWFITKGQENTFYTHILDIMDHVQLFRDLCKSSLIKWGISKQKCHTHLPCLILYVTELSLFHILQEDIGQTNTHRDTDTASITHTPLFSLSRGH